MSSCAQQDHIVLILTDDQRADTVWAMPKVQKILSRRGTTFTQAFATTPECCPSRASLLAGGFYPHQTRVLTNTPPAGGIERFDDVNTLATLLKAKGYRTAWVGKYLNGYERRAPYVPPGWDRFVVPLTGEKEELSGGDWFAYQAAVDGRLEDVDQYVTDYLRDQARDFIRANIRKGPLFLVVSTPAPHTPATPAPEDLALFADFVPTGPGIEELALEDKPQWVRDAAASPGMEALELQALARDQLRSLQSVDRLVASLKSLLRRRKAMSRTRWIFTSDNGFMWGEHGGLAHKSKPYDESIRVPLVIRIPGGKSRTIADPVVMPLDVGQTIIAWGGSWVGSEGQDLTVCVMGGRCGQWGAGMLLQHFDTLSKRRADLWAGWLTPAWKYLYYPRTGEEELYDRVNDPHELQSRHAEPGLRPLMDTWRRQLNEHAGLVVVEDAAPEGRVGVPYSFRPTFLWGVPPYSAVLAGGVLPRGLRLDESTGEIGGIPKATEVRMVTIKAKDSSAVPYGGQPQNFYQRYTITIR